MPSNLDACVLSLSPSTHAQYQNLATPVGPNNLGSVQTDLSPCRCPTTHTQYEREKCCIYRLQKPCLLEKLRHGMPLCWGELSIESIFAVTTNHAPYVRILSYQFFIQHLHLQVITFFFYLARHPHTAEFRFPHTTCQLRGYLIHSWEQLRAVWRLVPFIHLSCHKTLQATMT